MADPAWTGDGFSAEPERGRRAFVAVMSALGDEDAGGARAASTTATARTAGSTACSRSNARSPIDPHDFLYQSWAYEAHDVGASPRLRRRHRRGAALGAGEGAGALPRRSTCSIRRPRAGRGGGDAERALRRDPSAQGPPGGDQPRWPTTPRSSTARSASSSRAEPPARAQRVERLLPPGDDRAEREQRRRAGRPARRLPARSAMKPTPLGPTIWPTAKTIVKPVMPAASRRRRGCADQRGRSRPRARA
jgi:hypothetical protein